jgi:hypothetical protein
VDSRDPDTVVVSAASGPWRAHSASEAQSVIYRRMADGEWERVTRGLPDADGTIVSSIAAARSSGTFYLANNRGIYSSDDSGLTWKRLEVLWSGEYQREHAWGIALGCEG